MKSWKRRYFELRSEFLYYYRQKGVPGPLGVIDIGEAKGVGERVAVGVSYGFEIVTDSRTYVLVSKTERG